MSRATCTGNKGAFNYYKHHERNKTAWGLLKFTWLTSSVAVWSAPCSKDWEQA